MLLLFFEGVRGGKQEKMLGTGYTLMTIPKFPDSSLSGAMGKTI